ncbi:hypothetical protein B7939_00830 [Eggerthia catenaformis]|nr:hypothetical protein B7939_00830 [Eggerthia catenaformis]
MAYYSPLRYPGGKGKMYRQTLNILADNNLLGCTYVEAFAGGANLALNLLFRGDVESIILNDNDPAIYSMWAAILNYGPEFINMIINTPVTLEEWKNQKQIYTDGTDSILKLGFSAFFLNRTNHSGIISSGPIGGYEQKGNYHIDCRFNKESLAKRVKRIYDSRAHIQIFDFDARDFLRLHFPDNTFFFIDPPYFVKGHQLYKNSFREADHIQVSEAVRQLHYPWVVTYDNVPQIRSMYSTSAGIEYELTYTAETKRTGAEIMFYRNDLNINF